MSTGGGLRRPAGRRSTIGVAILLPLAALLLAAAASGPTPARPLGRHLAWAGTPAATSAAASATLAALEGTGSTAAALATLPSPLPPALWPAAVALRAGDRPAAATDLRALLAELAARPGPARGLAGVTAALAATYADPALARARAAAPPPNWLLTVLRWLYSLLRRLFHALPGSAWILIGAIVVVLGAATAVWRLRRTVGGPEARASSSSSPLPSAPDPAELWRAAEAAAARGASREAVRLAFAALLATAAGHRALAVDPAWTNAELLRAAERSGRLGAALRPVVGTFDATVYGGQDPGPEGCLEFLRRCRALARTLA